QQVGGDTWQQVTTGVLHTCGIRSDGLAACWGHNEAGELGDGTQADSSLPGLVGNATWIDLSAGSSHTCGVRSDHVALCWGANTYGQVAADGSSTYST